MKQSTRLWGHSLNQGSLYTFLSKLISDGYTIVSITPTDYDKYLTSETHYQVIAATIIVSK